MEKYIEGNKAAWEEAFENRDASWGDDITERIRTEEYPFFNEETKNVLKKLPTGRNPDPGHKPRRNLSWTGKRQRFAAGRLEILGKTGVGRGYDDPLSNGQRPVFRHEGPYPAGPYLLPRSGQDHRGA